MRIKALLPFFLAMAASTLPCWAADSEPRETDQQSGIDAAPAIAFGSALFSSLALLTFNRFVTRADYAMISPDSVMANLTSEWVWDQDEFAVNHIGHPYQGSAYYIAGRANGLGFLPSAAITVCNSAIWELVMETETPSKNDIIATSLGGIALGEIFHRVSREVLPASAPISFAISPMDGFSLIFSPLNPRTPLDEPTGLSGGELSLGAGLVTSSWLSTNGLTGQSLARSMTATVMANARYGEIYGCPTAEPFSQFEASLQATLSADYYAVNLLSDGILVAITPFPLSRNDHTLGISLHYDVLYSEPVNFSANSLGLSWKSRVRLERGAQARFTAHVNWVVLGASDYVYLRSGPGAVNATGQERRDYDLGTGAGIKLSAGYTFPKGTEIGINYAGYGIKTIPASVPDGGSEGYAVLGSGNLQVERPVGAGLSAGMVIGLWHRQGIYENAPDADDRIALMSLYARHGFD